MAGEAALFWLRPNERSISTPIIMLQRREPVSAFQLDSTVVPYCAGSAIAGQVIESSIQNFLLLVRPGALWLSQLQTRLVDSIVIRIPSHTEDDGP